MFRLLLSAMAVTTYTNETAAATKCFPPPQSDFAANCATADGILEGGQCFFVVDAMGTWHEVWTICGNAGARLAQLQTLNEYNKVFNYVKKRFAKCHGSSYCPLYAFTLAYRDQSKFENGQTSCAIEQDSHWYHNETEAITSLDREKTIAKYYDCIDTKLMTTGPRCFSLSWTDDDCDTGWDVLNNGWYPVCQLTNPNQNFSKSGYCMLETGVEIVSGPSVDDCAYECAQRPYCRSFNFDANSGECALFARSILDCKVDKSKCPHIGPETIDCVHYNYIP